MFTGGRYHRNERIVEVDRCATLLKQLNQFQRRTFTRIADISLVGQPHDQNAGAVQTLLEPQVELFRDTADHITWHRRIYLAGQLNQSRGYLVFASFPGQIKWIDRNAMTSESGTRIKRHETERFCSRRLDDFPDINPHL